MATLIDELTDELECVKIGLQDLQELNFSFKENVKIYRVFPKVVAPAKRVKKRQVSNSSYVCAAKTSCTAKSSCVFPATTFGNPLYNYDF